MVRDSSDFQLICVFNFQYRSSSEYVIAYKKHIRIDTGVLWVLTQHTAIAKKSVNLLFRLELTVEDLVIETLCLGLIK